MFFSQIPRSALKSLMPAALELQSTKAQMYYTATKKPEYKVFVSELVGMCEGLDKFMGAAQVLLAECEDLSQDSPDDRLAACKIKVSETEKNCSHHLTGVKSAQTRYRAIVDIS